MTSEINYVRFPNWSLLLSLWVVEHQLQVILSMLQQYLLRCKGRGQPEPGPRQSNSLYATDLHTQLQIFNLTFLNIMCQLRLRSF